MPEVIVTVWSGAVLVIVNVPLEVIGLPVIAIPVPAVAATLVTVPVVGVVHDGFADAPPVVKT